MSTIRDVFGNIANAIRYCNGSSNTYTPTQMPDAIRRIDPLYGVSLSVKPALVWKSGTDNDVLTMIQAADAGTIDLTNYWSVGDTRTVQLSSMSATGVGERHNAQTVEMVLMHANPDKYTYVTTPNSGRTKPYFIYGQKNCLKTQGYIYPTATYESSWSRCPRRTWCNNVYRNAVPTYLKTITKQVKVIAASSTGSGLETLQDYFFLAAAKEIIGGEASHDGQQTGYSTLAEFNALEQWTWYATLANRSKNIPGWGPDSWWLRSLDCDDGRNWCYMTGSGGDSAMTTNTFGLAPHGCI